MIVIIKSILFHHHQVRIIIIIIISKEPLGRVTPKNLASFAPSPSTTLGWSVQPVKRRNSESASTESKDPAQFAATVFWFRRRAVRRPTPRRLADRRCRSTLRFCSSWDRIARGLCAGALFISRRMLRSNWKALIPRSGLVARMWIPSILDW